MSSATEDAVQIRNLILELFSHAGEGDFKPENAHDYDDAEDCELSRAKHSLFSYSMLNRLPGGMVGQDGGQPWFIYWLTNAIEIANFEQIKLTA